MLKTLFAFLFLCFAVIPQGASAVQISFGRLRDNLAATAPPGVSNDASQGYTVGSKWIDTSTEIVWRATDVSIGAAVWVPDSAHPGTVASRFWATFDGAISTSTAVGTLDTIIYLYPFSVDRKLAVTSLNLRTVTGAGSCAVKMGLWANDPITTHRPTGTPLVASNTGQSCVTSATNATITVSITLHPRKIYWFGAAFTTAAPQMMSIASGGGVFDRLLGRAVMGSNTLTGLSAPFTYSNDITALDLTSATFTDVAGSVGVPRMMLGN